MYCWAWERLRWVGAGQHGQHGRSIWADLRARVLMGRLSMPTLLLSLPTPLLFGRGRGRGRGRSRGKCVDRACRVFTSGGGGGGGNRAPKNWGGGLGKGLN